MRIIALYNNYIRHILYVHIMHMSHDQIKESQSLSIQTVADVPACKESQIQFLTMIHVTMTMIACECM